VVGCSETREGVVIDPGDEIERVTAKVEAHGLIIKYILLTHGHIDHVKEVVPLKKKIDVPVLMHRDDLFLLEALPQQAAAFGLTFSGIPSIDRHLEEGDKVAFGTHEFSVLCTPGHSPGSVSFVERAVVFSGDVLFAGSIGRADLPGADHATLIDSIKVKLLPLDDDLIVYPGHGPATTIGRERRSNPFLVNMG
jgi:glyoxylase-like metal-dependent hydrolase (beta-lactamase superfamily II)